MMTKNTNSKNRIANLYPYQSFKEFFTRKNFLFSLLLVTFFSSCSQSETSSGYKDVDNKVFTAEMKQQNTMILDVRTPEEYTAGHIPQATLINFYDKNFSLQLDSLDKSQTYLVYCAKGGRSSQACDIMIKKGFTNVLNLKNGFNAWDGATEK